MNISFSPARHVAGELVAPRLMPVSIGVVRVAAELVRAAPVAAVYVMAEPVIIE